MNISEFTKPITAKSLNESLAKRFGKKINLSSFTLEQLQDARNKLRTQLFNVETNESFDSVAGDAYNKSKLMLDVLNAEISERGDIEDESIEEAGKPDFLDLDKDGDKKEPMKKAAKDAGKGKKGIEAMKKAGNAKADAEAKDRKASMKKKGGNPFKKTESIDEGKTIIANYFDTLLEGAEDHAELVMAAKDMVDRLTGWMEDTAEMQTESMLELADAIRDELGAEQAEGFTNTIKPALDQLYSSMESARQSLTDGVGLITGEGEAPAMGDDGMDDMDMDMEPTADMDDAGDLEAELGDDDFGAAEAGTGGEEPEERAKRESIDPRKLGKILSKKK